MTSDEAKTVIAEAIDRELKRLGWTWYRLGIVADISHATMSNIRNGVHDPKASNLKSIADALGVTVDLLLSAKPKKSAKKFTAVA